MKPKIEWLCPVAASDFEDVAETFGRQQGRLGSIALEQGIDHKRRAMLHESCVVCVKFGFADAVKYSVAQSTIRRRALCVGNCAKLDIARDEVGEGATNINCNNVGHAVSLLLYFPWTIACALVDLNSCAVDHVRPLRDSGLEHFSDVFGCTNPWGHAGT